MTLQVNGTTWWAFGGAVALWLISLVLAGTRDERASLKWRMVPLSFFGFAWVSFGVIFLLRFLMVVHDPVLFRATRYPLWLIPAGALSRTWLYLALYWLAFCAGVVAVRRAVGKRSPRFLGRLDLLESGMNVRVLDLLAACAAATILVQSMIRLPGALRTPVGHFSGLWVLPATIAWFMHFTGRPVGARRYVYLMPGVIAFLVSPYREHLVVLFLCVLLPVLAGKRRVGLYAAVGLVIAVLLGSSIVLYVYRPLRWEGKDLEVTSQYVNWESWRERPQEAPWCRLSTRLHGFDSAALTFHLVPAVFGHEDRSIGLELATSAFVPRAVYGSKVHVQRGRLFSTSIWAYDERGRTGRTESAMIAPSMPGDLWAAGGVKAVIIGALAWGALIGFLECRRRSLRPGPAAALVAYLGIRVAGGIERDFVHAAATIIQVLVVLVLVLAILPLRRAGPGARNAREHCDSPPRLS